MSVSAALQVAYASNRKGAPPIETLELDNATFDEPARIACSGVSADVSLPLILGDTAVLFRWCPTQVTPPGVTEEGPTPMKLRVQNVTRFLLPYLRAAKATTEPIVITYRVYLPSDLTQPQQVLTGYRLRVSNLDAVAVEATVALREIEMQAFPLRTYDAVDYPALQNA